MIQEPSASRQGPANDWLAVHYPAYYIILQLTEEYKNE